MRELDALLAGVVDAGEADHVRHDFAARVVAAVLALLVDALDAERRPPRRRSRAQSGASGRRSRASRRQGCLLELARFGMAEQRGELACAALARASTSAGIAHIDFTGVETASASPLRSRTRPRVAGDLEHARVARLALLLQEIGLHRLQVHARAGQHRERRRAARSARSARATPAGAPGRCGRGCSPTGAPPRSSTTRTRRGSGARMPSVRGGDPLDPRMQAPGAGLELQLAVLDLELARARPARARAREQLARLVLRGDEPERAGDENQRGGGGSASPPRVGLDSECQVKVKGRRGALGDPQRGAARARVGCYLCGRTRAVHVPSSLSAGCGISLARSGKSAGQLGTRRGTAGSA